jgi:hypothetical protein
VGHEQHGGAGAGADGQQLVLHALAGQLVQRPEGLVHEQQRRLERQRAGDGDALLHPAGQLRGAQVGDVGEVDELEHPLRAGAALRRAPAHDLQRQLDVAPDRAPVEQRRGLEDHAVVAALAGLTGGPAGDGHRPRRRRHQVGDDAQQRGLAAARGPQQRHERPRRHVQRHRRQRGGVAVVLAHPAQRDHTPRARARARRRQRWLAGHGAAPVKRRRTARSVSATTV